MENNQGKNTFPRINKNQIQQRTKSLKIYLVQQHQRVLIFTKQLIEKALKSKLKAKVTDQSYDIIVQGFKLFVNAAQSILNVFFALYQQQSVLLINTAESIQKQIGDLRKMIQRVIKNLSKSFGKTYKDLVKQVQAKMLKQDKPRAPNCKIAAQHTTVLMIWLLQNTRDPYPTQDEIKKLAALSHLAPDRVSNWFINTREKMIKKYLKSNHTALKASSLHE